MYSEWYERVFHELHHQGLWLRGGELNTLPLAERERRDLRVLFVRLSTYFDTGYSFTHQLLYQLAAGTEGVYPDLGYLPPRADLPRFAADRVPWLLGTQSKQGPSGFDVIGFSNSIVQELVNIRSFLTSSGIPLGKRARLARPEVPLLLLGGANALYSSVLWNDDPPVDGVFVGEDDGSIRRILETCRDSKRAGRSKAELLVELEAIPGFVQPDRPRPTKKAFVWNLDKSEALAAGPVYYLEDQLGGSHLQISEGCPCFCSFCAESWDRKPYRERQAPVLTDAALAAKRSMGLDTIDIYSFNFNMHSGFYQVLWELVPLFRRIGLKSQRFDLLAHDPEMVEVQHTIEKASLTCGLEGISPRLRRYLHKNIEDGDLHKSLTAIFKSRARALKIFLIATGLEQEQDFVAFQDLLGHIEAIRNQYGAHTRVVLSVTPLVRFPWTPLEFEDAPPPARFHGILAEIATHARRAGFEMRESAELPEYLLSQLLVRAADPRIGAALAAATAATGFVYYREVPESFTDAFTAELAVRGLELDALLAGFDLEASRAKPWTAIDTGVHREFLWAEVERAREYKEIDYCLGRAWTRVKCFHCGGCPSKEHIRNIVLARQDRDYTPDDFAEHVRAVRDSEREVQLLVKVGERGRGVPRKLVGVAVARALMLGAPELAPGYRGYNGSVVDCGSEGAGAMPLWLGGLDALTLAFREEALAPLAAVLRDPVRLAACNAHLEGWGEILGAAPVNPAPGRSGLAGWRPLRVEICSPYPWAGEAYLQSLHLKYSTTKNQGALHFELAPASRKKGFVSSLVVTPTPEGGARVVLEPGPKLALQDFLSRSFKLPQRHAWVRIRAEVTAGSPVEAAPARPASLPLAASGAAR